MLVAIGTRKIATPCHLVREGNGRGKNTQPGDHSPQNHRSMHARCMVFILSELSFPGNVMRPCGSIVKLTVVSATRSWRVRCRGYFKAISRPQVGHLSLISGPDILRAGMFYHSSVNLTTYGQPGVWHGWRGTSQ